MGDTNVVGVHPNTSEQQAAKLSAHRWAWNPQAVWLAMPPSSSSATAPGSTRSRSGLQNGVWVKCTARRSGRSWASHVPTSDRW